MVVGGNGEGREENSLEISFYNGDTREQRFDVYGDGSPLCLKSKSSGKSTALQSFPLKEPTSLKRVTIFGNGNSEDHWNSITEVMVCGEQEDPQQHDDPAGEEEECDTYELEIADVNASADDGNEAASVIGKVLKPRWSCKPKASKSPSDSLRTRYRNHGCSPPSC